MFGGERSVDSKYRARSCSRRYDGGRKTLAFWLLQNYYCGVIAAICVMTPRALSGYTNDVIDFLQKSPTIFAVHADRHFGLVILG